MKLALNLGLLATTALAPLTQAAQIPFSFSDSAELNTLTHPALPAHSLRVTSPPSHLCDSSVRSYSGYLDVDVDKLREHDLEPSSHKDGNKHPRGTMEHFYFWAFESRNDPKTDPVVLWLNGGPGCSSFTGLLMELGPCNAVNPKHNNGRPATERNPWAWNNNATLIFLDQPVGVGYSYNSWTDKSRKDKPPARVYSTPAAARDASAFLHLLAMHAGKEIFGTDRDIYDGETGELIRAKGSYPSFHIAGESYGGRYIPLIANQILEDNERALAHPEHGIQPLPLKSVLIGNGITSPKHQYPAYVSYTCTNASGTPDGVPLLPQQTCDKMYQAIPVCLTLVEKCNRLSSHYDSLACQTAETYCEGSLASPYDSLNKSPYDWQHPADYAEEEWVAAFLNDPSTQKALGVDRRGPGDKHDGVFIGCSDAVYKNFAKTGDGARESTWAVRNILEKGIKVLTYSGKRDFICNYVGNRDWAEELEWSGGDQFRKQQLQPWFVDPHNAKRGGDFKSFDKFTYLTVESAGHFVPHE